MAKENETPTDAPAEGDDFGKGVFEEAIEGEGTPEVETPTVSAVEPVADEPVEPAPVDTPSSTLTSTLSDLGFRDVESEEDAQARLVQAYQEQLNQTAALEQRAREAEIRAAVRDMQPQAAPAPVADSEPSAPQYWPAYTSVDPQMINKYRETYVDPETNQLAVRWSADTPADLRASYDRYTTEVEQWTNKLAYEPQQTLQPIIEDLAERKVREIMQSSFGFAPEEISSRLDLSGEQAAVDNFMGEWGGKLYELDPVTRQPTQRLSDFGSKVDQAMIEAYDMGLTSKAQQIHYARKVLAGEFATLNGAATQVTAEEVREERKIQKQQRGGRKTRDASGSLPREEGEVQNQNLTPGQALAAAMREAGEL